MSYCCALFLGLLLIYTKLGPISRTLNSQSREAACETLLAIAVRHAPTLLDYKPSYKGVLKKKEKKKDSEPNEPSIKEVGGPSTGPAQKKRKAAPAAEGTQKKRQPGVKLPRIGYTLEEWLSPAETEFVFDSQPPRHNPPLQISEPNAEEMSRRNNPRPIIPTKTAVPGKSSGASGKDKQPQQKKQKTTEREPGQPIAAEHIPVVDSSVPDPVEKELLQDPHIDLTDPQIVAAIQRPFSPSYAMPDGRVLMLKDSVKEEPNLAVTLLRGLALPRDCDQVPAELLPGLGEMCSHLVQAGQAAQKAYDKAVKVSAEKERYKTERDSYRTKWRISEQQVKDSDAELEKLKKELAETKTAAVNAEAEVKKVREAEREKLKVADAKGYEAGIKRATLEYTQVAHRMVNEALTDRLPDFYRRGYAAGAKEMAAVMVIQAESGFLKQLPEPVIPDLELPYTEEECADLPPKEDDDEEMAEASGKDKPAEGEVPEKATQADGQDAVDV